MDVRLVVDKGGRKKKVLRLKSEETVIGRRQDCDLRIPSEDVSRRHALLSIHDGRVTVEDLDSVNGVFVNDRRITGKQVVMPGDHLEIGPVVFVVEYEMTQQVLDEVRKSQPGRAGARRKLPDDLEEVDVLPVDDDADALEVLPVLDEEPAGGLEDFDDLQVVDDEPVTLKQPIVKNPLAKPGSKQAPKPAPAPAPPPDDDDDAPIPLLDDAEDLGSWKLPQGGEDMRSLLSGMDDGRSKSKRKEEE